jgi:hypothetical protein
MMIRDQKWVDDDVSLFDWWGENDTALNLSLLVLGFSLSSQNSYVHKVICW